MSERMKSRVYVAIAVVVLVIAVIGIAWAASSWGAASQQAEDAYQDATSTLQQ